MADKPRPPPARTRAHEPRLLIYSQDGLGLGHLRRTTLLATEFLAMRPRGSVLTISDSPAGQFFSTSSGHDYLKLPTIRKAAPGDWRPVSLSMPFVEMLSMRQQILRTVALNFQPDVVLVDHMPHGAMGELIPMIKALASRSVRLVLGLRDILDAPSTVRYHWGLEGAMESIEDHFHRVLVYGSRDVFDVARQYGLSPSVREKLRYCGYVSAPEAAGSQEPSRPRMVRRREQGDFIVAMAGGGADAGPMFVTLMRALTEITSRRRCFVLLVTGPFLPAADRAELQRLAHGQPVRIVPAVSDSLRYMKAADLVISMAGYNTCVEILSLGKRALLVPRAGPSAEQRMRASRFAQRGWVRWLPPTSLKPEALADAVVEALEAPDHPAQKLPDLGGRQLAASLLIDELPHDGFADGMVPLEVGGDGGPLPVVAQLMSEP